VAVEAIEASSRCSALVTPVTRFSNMILHRFGHIAKHSGRVFCPFVWLFCHRNR
jgi:hypothetical protein